MEGMAMLVLSREVEEDIVIGDNIVVRVVSIRGRKVRLGVIAPKEVVVDRKEVREAITAEAALSATKLPA
jgi:carbon storage regulator